MTFYGAWILSPWVISRTSFKKLHISIVDFHALLVDTCGIVWSIARFTVIESCSPPRSIWLSMPNDRKWFGLVTISTSDRFLCDTSNVGARREEVRSKNCFPIPRRTKYRKPDRISPGFTAPGWTYAKKERNLFRLTDLDHARVWKTLNWNEPRVLHRCIFPPLSFISTFICLAARTPDGKTAAFTRSTLSQSGREDMFVVSLAWNAGC